MIDLSSFYFLSNTLVQLKYFEYLCKQISIIWLKEKL
nr:MAG TPA: hypothetical protein [Crassvirales sp.]